MLPVTIASARKGVETGAVAYPARRWLKVGRRTAVRVGYAGIVNPATRPLPRVVLGFLGNPEDPSAVLLPAQGRSPGVGAIYLSGSSPQLPRGLISKVTGVRKRGAEYVARLEAVPVTEAVPSLDFDGNLAFRPGRSPDYHLRVGPWVGPNVSPRVPSCPLKNGGPERIRLENRDHALEKFTLGGGCSDPLSYGGRADYPQKWVMVGSPERIRSAAPRVPTADHRC
ncbi:MAG: hypothetical protein JSS97_20285 [Actinobacteria bacterium]|nr:hypothetical protein [Actinomycetota bacterium]